MLVTFEDYVMERLPALLRLAGALCGNRHTAEDVVQEVLLRAAGRWEQISAANSPDAYVRRMVINEHRSWRRKWARLIPHPEIVDTRSEPDHAVRHAEYDAMVRRLAQLPARQRAVIVLRYYEGLGDADIAVLVGCSQATVRSHASRALKGLQLDDSRPAEPNRPPGVRAAIRES